MPITRKFRPGFGPKKYPCGRIPLATAETAYQEGYESGQDWDRFYPHNNYVPSGPHVSGAGFEIHPDPYWRQYCNATIENHQAWMRGWHHGRRDVLELIRAYELGDLYQPRPTIIELKHDEAMP